MAFWECWKRRRVFTGFLAGGFAMIALGIGMQASAMAGTGSPDALPDDALIIVGADSSGAIADQVNTRLAITSALQNLNSLYGSVDVLSSPGLTSSDLVAAIRERSSASNVDVLVFSGGSQGTPPSPGSAHFKNLRLVYLSGQLGGQSSSVIARRWKSAGARISVAQSDFTRCSSLSAQRFVYRWAQGWSAEDAAKDAASYSSAALRALGGAASVDAQPGLAMAGENLDRKGDVSGHVSTMFVLASQSRVGGQASGQASDREEARSALQSAAIAVSSALLPAVTVNPAKVSGAGDFLSKAEPLAWGQLQNLFSSGLAQAPAVDTDPGAQEIWVDGEFLQYIAAPMQNYLGGKFADVLKYLQGVKLDRGPTSLEISVYFSQAFDIQLKPESGVSSFQLYAVHIPKTVRVSVASSGSGTNASVVLTGLDSTEGPSEDQIFLDVKLPISSTKVYLRNLSADLGTGGLTAEAGILGDTIGLVADAKISAAKLQPKLDFWGSVEQNLSFFDWPVLTFSPVSP